MHVIPEFISKLIKVINTPVTLQYSNYTSNTTQQDKINFADHTTTTEYSMHHLELKRNPYV
jgi:hypothetical protein